MSVQIFYNPVLVEKLRRVGIGVGARRQLPIGEAVPGPRTALELVEECARLRAQVGQLQAENRRLSDESARLRGEAEAARGSVPRREEREELLALDDAAQRFSLLELDL